MKHSRVLQHYASKLSDSLNDKSSLYARRQLAQIQRMASMVESLESISLNRNPSETEGRHIKKIAEATSKMQGEAARIREQAHGILADGLDSLNNGIREKSGLVPNEYANEIRQAFRSMNDEQRAKALNQALEDGDGALIAAVADAPTILTGVGDELKWRTTEALERQKAPELVQQREELGQAFDMTLRAVSSVKSAIREGFDPQKLREVESAEATHSDAVQQFESALTGTE